MILKVCKRNGLPLRLSSLVLAIFVPMNFWSYIAFSPLFMGISLLFAAAGIWLDHRSLFVPKLKTEQFVILLIPITFLIALIGLAFKPANEAFTNLVWFMGGYYGCYMPL